MCFLNECDWYATVVERTQKAAEKQVTCDECCRKIAVGGLVHRIHMQECEYCKACENGFCDCPEEECCKCEDPNLGETFDYRCCDDCHRFLEAVEAAEVEAGCHRNEARPGLGSMKEEINNGGMDEAKRYWKQATQMFPDLVKSGYLGWLWRKIFEKLD